MLPEEWSLADELFDRALDLPEEERATFLDKECEGRPELRSWVAKLLELAERHEDEPLPGSTSNDALIAAIAADEGPERLSPGDIVGRFRVVREIGRGGMAVVYLAERADGEFDQQVALKLIRRGAGTEEVLRRFAQERQILAAVSHPNISRLVDGGSTPDGLPYFIMELVEGKRIDAYCDERGLTVPERLELFLQVADAVGYAHRNLVVHRDIKPSNILVDADGRAKLLDFGIAYDLDSAAAQEEGGTGRRFLTPLWASPEQVRGENVTTASDVYQLGLLLYRLLAGRPPHKADGDDAEALRRAVCDEIPIRPSVVAGRAAGRELIGDLDAICLMALEKEPERRYASVAQLVDDVQRYLGGLPVAARPDTATYRIAKLVRRHRVGAGFAGLALVALVTLAITMTIQSGRIARERDRANREAAVATSVVDFLTGLFRVSEPGEAQGNSITARSLLDQGAEEIERELDGQPELQARLMLTMGQVYQQLGLYPQAEELVDHAAHLRQAALGVEHRETLDAESQRAALYFEQARYDQAEPIVRQTLERQRDALGQEDPETLFSVNLLGNIYSRLGRYEESEALYIEALEARRRVLGVDAPETIDSRSNLAALYWSLGRTDDAEPLFVETYESRKRIFGENHPDALNSLNNLANLYQRQKRFDRARLAYLDCLEGRRRILGEDHPKTLTSMHNLAALYQKLERYEESERLYLETLASRRRVLGDGHLKTLRTMNGLADLYNSTSRHDEAEPLFRDALEAQRTLLGEDHAETAVTMHNLACVLRDIDRFAEAQELFETSLAILVRTLGADHAFVKLSQEEQEVLRHRMARVGG